MQHCNGLSVEGSWRKCSVSTSGSETGCVAVSETAEVPDRALGIAKKLSSLATPVTPALRMGRAEGREYRTVWS